MAWLPLPDQPGQPLRPDLRYGAASVNVTGSSTSFRYAKVDYSTSVSGRCPVCGKRRTRRRTFWATTSPFNLDPATGQPRTRGQVYAVLQDQAERWVPDFTCTTACTPPAPSPAPSAAACTGSRR